MCKRPVQMCMSLRSISFPMLTALSCPIKKAIEATILVTLSFIHSPSWKVIHVYVMQLFYFHHNSFAWLGNAGRRQKWLSSHISKQTSPLVRILGGFKTPLTELQAREFLVLPKFSLSFTSHCFLCQCFSYPS